MDEWLPTHFWHPQGATFLMARGTPRMLTTGHSSHPSPPPAVGISSALKSMSFTCESKMLTTRTVERLYTTPQIEKQPPQNQRVRLCFVLEQKRSVYM